MRLTKKVNGRYSVKDLKQIDEYFYGDAIDKLAMFETMVEHIIAEQEEYSRQIDELRDEDSGKIHWRVKELMGKKLVNKGLLLALKYHGIDDGEDDEIKRD